jgi:secreted PhoX family phosphatase
MRTWSAISLVLVTLPFAPCCPAQSIINTVAGNGVAGFSGDGGPATSASLNFPPGVAVDASGNLFIADQANHRIRQVDGVTGIITTVAGNGVDGFSGDGGPATSASLNFPPGVTVDASGNLFIPDNFNSRIRRVDGVTGIITTVAGNGVAGFSGDGGPATSASLQNPAGVAVDGFGNLFIACFGNHRIRKVDGVTGIITTVAGNGLREFSGDGGPATSASLSDPFGVVLDASGNLFIADDGNNRIRKVDGVTAIITTVAGNGTPGFSGDGGPATSASLRNPTGVTVDGFGNLFIADYNNHRIRQVDGVTAIITTVAGNGTPGFSGDGGPATTASLNQPAGVAVDDFGNLFVADAFNHRIRQVVPTP